MSDDHPPEPNRIEGAPLPRATVTLFGHEAAEAAFLEAHAAGRLHHAWMLAGPSGIGKATLAWRMARFLAADTADTGDTGDTGGPGLFGDPPPATLQMDPSKPVFRRALALGEPAIAQCVRPWDDKAKRLKTAITVDEIRKLRGHFTMSASGGGWRVAIIDAADEMNLQAANALLKLLEEPPARSVILLVCHQPQRLLPTIRSRCRVLRLAPLSAEDMGRALLAADQTLDDLEVLHLLTGGSVGQAIQLAEGGGLEIYPRILGVLGQMPGADRAAMLAIGAGAAGRANAATYAMITDLILLALSRLARAGAGSNAPLLGAERAALPRLCPTPEAARALAQVHASLTSQLMHARAVNLDPEHVILDMFVTLERNLARLRPMPSTAST